jgi:hypothetical protein
MFWRKTLIPLIADDPSQRELRRKPNNSRASGAFATEKMM